MNREYSLQCFVILNSRPDFLWRLLCSYLTNFDKRLLMSRMVFCLSGVRPCDNKCAKMVAIYHMQTLKYEKMREHSVFSEY